MFVCPSEASRGQALICNWQRAWFLSKGTFCISFAARVAEVMILAVAGVITAPVYRCAAGQRGNRELNETNLLNPHYLQIHSGTSVCTDGSSHMTCIGSTIGREHLTASTCSMILSKRRSRFSLAPDYCFKAHFLQLITQTS